MKTKEEFALDFIKHMAKIDNIHGDWSNDISIKFIEKALEELEELKKSDASKEQSSIDYFNEFKRVERELEELKAKAHILTFSNDNEFVHIKGKGVYRKQDLEQNDLMTIKVKIDELIKLVGDKDE